MRFDPERIAEQITQVPGRSCGASPPATPKLTIPGQLPNSVRASAIAAVSVAVRLRPLPAQMTCLPGPAAMRASNASPTTMIKSPPAPHFADQDRTTVPRMTSKLQPLAARTHYHDQLLLCEPHPAVSAFASRFSGSCWQICHALDEIYLCECLAPPDSRQRQRIV